MKRVAVFFFAALALSFGQSHGRQDEYALMLSDAPAIRSIQSRSQLNSAAAKAAVARIRKAQDAIRPELARRNVRVAGTSQVLVNAIFVNTTEDVARSLANLPGVEYVVSLPPVKPALTTALGLQNVPAAWSALGGDTNAGAGVRIGIIDSGIDQNHAGFKDTSLQPPSGFPAGDTGYTNSKVIVARSYMPQTVTWSGLPDDVSPRDHLGHGTAIAMIAAGVKNTGPQGAIEGVAPKAFLGSYKVFGSPGINDYADPDAVIQALTDALNDHMDIVTLSMYEGDSVIFGPLDTPPAACSSSFGSACDPIAIAVENAVSNGMVVVTAAGNAGNIGTKSSTLNSILTPGDAPSAITVGASTNSHIFYQAVHVTDSGAPTNLQNIQAVLSNGPRLKTPLTATITDASQVGSGCAALPPGSLNGAIALMPIGTCVFYLDTIEIAQNAGAVAAILYQGTGTSLQGAGLSAPTSGIPAALIGNADGTALKTYVDAHSGAKASLDPALKAVDSQAYAVAPYSSRGPTPGLFAINKTLAIKPELVAVGDNVYTATETYDPSGGMYDATGYTAASGTSFAVPMVAGAAALVKQQFPGFTPAQIKSALVNTATQNVTDGGGAASVYAAGAGQLSAADALNVPATLDPATLQFGVVNPASSASVSLTLKITNVGKNSATFGFADLSTSALQVQPASLTLSPGQQNSITLTLNGRQTTPGPHEGFIVVTEAAAPGGTPTLRVPYQYIVASGVVSDAFPLQNSSFSDAPNDVDYFRIAFRAIDSAGVPVAGQSVAFKSTSGGGSIASGDSATDRLGDAGAYVNTGAALGPQTFSGAVGGFTVPFYAYIRPYPNISNGVSNAASGTVGQGLAPGSYVSIYGSSLADSTLVESTPSLPVSLAGVSVMFDGGGLLLPGHIHFVSPSQVNVQIPWEYQGQKSVNMMVMCQYLISATYTLPLATYSPGVFLVGSNAAVLDWPGYKLVDSSNAAQRGQVIQIYVNGMGPLDQAQTSGDPASTTQLANTTTKPTVTIGGVAVPPGDVLFSGLAPGIVGLYQVNVIVPASAPTGNQPLIITIGGVASAQANLPVR
jgi:minor extracellular serine protease Vpr